MAKNCTFEGCKRPLFCRGLCTAHDAQRRRGSELHPIGEKKPRKGKTGCSFAGCANESRAFGLCWSHRLQQRNGYQLTPVGTRPLLTNPEVPGTLLVPLSDGRFAIIDEADRNVVAPWNWTSSEAERTYYAFRTIEIDGVRKSLPMHRALWESWGLPATPEIDHRNTDGLDNRRENLRAATHTQNMWNQRLRADNTSGHKGVTWDARTKNWAARYRKDGRMVFLGRFDDVEAAAAARRAAVEQEHGEFVRHE